MCGIAGFLGVPRAAREVLAEQGRAAEPLIVPGGHEAATWRALTAPMLESLLAIRRAGAEMIITYFATDAARLLRG